MKIDASKDLQTGYLVWSGERGDCRHLTYITVGLTGMSR